LQRLNQNGLAAVFKINVMYYAGILLGLATFLIIGLFHPLVIKAEYHFGVKFWIVFLVAGIATSAASLFVANTIASAILGVFGFSCFWSIQEMFDQVKRVEQGRFPKNPKRQNKA
jgi:hypothetical protein